MCSVTFCEPGHCFLMPADFVETGAKGKEVVMPMIDVCQAVTSSMVVCGLVMS